MQPHFLKSTFKICILFSLWVLFFNHLYIKPHPREEIEERIDAITGCPCPGFSTAFSIRPQSKCRARGWDAPSFCFSPCSSSFLDASSALGGRCQSCLASQCFSSTSVLSSRRSPSNTAGSSVDSSCEKQSTTKFMLNKKTIRGYRSLGSFMQSFLGSQCRWAVMGWFARSRCSSPCSASYSDPFSSRDGRWPNWWGFQCSSSTFFLW